MRIYDASYWQNYTEYSRKKKPIKRSKKATKKEKEKKTIIHNTDIKRVATEYANKMRNSPSVLENKMCNFLINQNVDYEFQRVFYIRKKNGWIKKFYIADFYIPTKNLIIETDGAFHNMQQKEDELRTTQIQEHYPNIKVTRWNWNDFHSYTKTKHLIEEIK